jgi:hypothetical protein
MLRHSSIAALIWLALLVTGCNRPKEPPIWETVKIGDLAPGGPKADPNRALLKAIGFDVHVFEVPADNINKLNEMWQVLYVRPLRFYSHYAFQANLFSAGACDMRCWGAINDVIAAAGGHPAARVSLLMADRESQNVTITGLNDRRDVTYVSEKGSRDRATIGPGILSLYVEAQRAAGTRDLCSVIAYPLFAVPTAQTLPPIAAMAKAREVRFTAAGFGLRMAPKDLVVLGPSQYTCDDTTLPGLFFTNLQGAVFFDETKRALPERKPSLRVFVIVCTRCGG